MGIGGGLLIIGGVLLIGGTIAEDVVTGGIGFLDDPLTIGGGAAGIGEGWGLLGSAFALAWPPDRVERRRAKSKGETRMISDELPWQVQGDETLPLTMFVGVSAPARVDRALAIEVLREAIALAQGWIGLDVTWSTLVWVDEDDARPSVKKASRPGLNWEFASSRPGTVQTIHLNGVCTALAQFPTHPKHMIADVTARFPVSVRGRDVGRMSVTISVQRWAMFGAGQDMAWVAGPVSPWVLRNAETLGADTGYAIADRVRASDDQSALERRSQVPYAGFGSEPDVWGYGWGTLLSPAHVGKIGGVAGLTGLPDARVQELAGGRVWVTLGEDPSQVSDAVMWHLRDVLQPAFPAPGVRWEDLAVVPAPAAPSTVEEVRAAWQSAADAARTAGRERGMDWPVGFTLSADVPELVVPHATSFAGGLIMFEGLGAQEAAVLLDRLDAEVLDQRDGAGPTLRTALRAAVAHPGVILLTGHAVGPDREDERVTVDGMHLHNDPLLNQLGPNELGPAWQRVQDLGINDALATPDELRAPTTPDGHWTAWWD